MKKLIQFYKLAWSVAPGYILLLLANAVVSSVKILLNVILPMYLINELLGGQEIGRLFLWAGLIVLNNVGMTFLTNTLKRFLDVREVSTNYAMLELLSKKIMNLEYSYLENPTYLDLKEQAVFAINNQNAIVSMFSTLSEVLCGIFTLLGLFSVLVTLGDGCSLVPTKSG